jgi:hypothetical protein
VLSDRFEMQQVLSLLVLCGFSCFSLFSNRALRHNPLQQIRNNSADDVMDIVLVINLAVKRQQFLPKNEIGVSQSEHISA